MRIQSTPTPAGTERVLEIAKVKIPLPGWAVTAISALGLLGACVWGGFWIIDHVHSDQVRVSKKVVADLNELQRHSGEDPIHSSVWNDPDGVTLVRKFADGCTTYRNEPADRKQDVISTIFRSHNAVAPLMTQRKNVSLEGMAWANDAPLRCVNPWTNHRGKFVWKPGEQYDGCRGDVIRTFEDGCEMAETYNHCTDPPTWSNARWLKCQGH